MALMIEFEMVILFSIAAFLFKRLPAANIAAYAKMKNMFMCGSVNICIELAQKGLFIAQTKCVK